MATEISPARARFGFHFIELARRWRRALDHRLAAAGLTDATWTPLIHLHQSGDGILQRELALRVGLAESSLVRLLDILCARGLIERRTDSDDRRARRVYLTEAGHAAVRDIRAALATAEADMLADIADEELVAMLDTLGRISLRVQTILDTQTREP